jgi:hypothetical protein
MESQVESTTLPLPPATPGTTTAPPRRLRTWPALLALLFLSPLVGEMMSGSTPPLLFVQPFALLFLPPLYGVSAVLIREIIVRRALGWGNALLLGAAFGIYQEALIVQTWFNFVSPQSPAHSQGTYGVVWGTNWNWALDLTIYHAVVSITIPLVLIGLFFPRRTALPWLGRKGTVALLIWQLLFCGALTVNAAFSQFKNDGYPGPPLVPYLVAVALTILALALGAFVRFPLPHLVDRSAPRLWTIRVACFAFMTVFFIGIAVLLPAMGLPAAGAMVVAALVFAWGLWRLRAWSARRGWGARHRLAVVTGLLMYFVFVWGPLVEFVLQLPARAGMTAVNVLIFVGLLLFDRRLKRREARVAAEAAEPAGVRTGLDTSAPPIMA